MDPHLTVSTPIAKHTLDMSKKPTPPNYLHEPLDIPEAALHGNGPSTTTSPFLQ